MCDISINNVINLLNEVMETEKFSEMNMDKDLSKMGVDSFNYVRIIVALEEKFQIEIPDEYLTLTAMNTIEKIVNVLQNL